MENEETSKQYTIRQVADMLHVSRQAIEGQLKTKHDLYKPYIHKNDDGVTAITSQALQLLAKHYRKTAKSTVNGVATDSAAVIKAKDELIAQLKAQVTQLQNEIQQLHTELQHEQELTLNVSKALPPASQATQQSTGNSTASQPSSQAQPASDSQAQSSSQATSETKSFWHRLFG